MQNSCTFIADFFPIYYFYPDKNFHEIDMSIYISISTSKTATLHGTCKLTTELIPKPADTYKFNDFHDKYYHIQYIRGGTLRGFDVMAISSA
jgi:hypothetical protein